ncbi:MAG: hypothetical protein LBE32_03800, partial [Burkholderiales bacterium]|nr:hypothetical protein [Burkholderiales bacterium]
MPTLTTLPTLSGFAVCTWLAVFSRFTVSGFFWIRIFRIGVFRVFWFLFDLPSVFRFPCPFESCSLLLRELLVDPIFHELHRGSVSKR